MGSYEVSIIWENEGIKKYVVHNVRNAKQALEEIKNAYPEKTIKAVEEWKAWYAVDLYPRYSPPTNDRECIDIIEVSDD